MMFAGVGAVFALLYLVGIVIIFVLVVRVLWFAGSWLRARSSIPDPGRREPRL